MTAIGHPARLGLAAALALGLPVQAQDKTFTLAAPEALVDSGLMQYILPRFSLKTQTRITLVAPGEMADAAFGETGMLVFEGLDTVWRFDAGEDPDARSFADWLRSDVGRNTVDSYEVDGAALFTSEVEVKQAVVDVSYDGDALRGEEVSLTHCGRCHVVSEKNRMNSIGSTPSFAVLRTLADWEHRFQAFYALNPHPAFTQVADVTEPFDPTRPSPIAAVEMTLADLENIMAFVQGIAPADLGGPVQSLQD
jgi:mono/diheme cytochrome c family protein